MWDIIKGVLISLFILLLFIGYVVFKIGLGVFDVGKDTVVGTYQTIRHPVEIGKNIVHSVKNPKQVLNTLGASIANDWEEDKLRSVGHFVGNIGLIFIPASKGAQVAEVSRLGVLNKVGNLGKIGRLESAVANTTLKSIDAGTQFGKEANVLKNISKLPNTFDDAEKLIKIERQNAVKQAWKQEKLLVENTGKGTRRWTNSEKKELLGTGKVKGYEGHHINSVNHYPDLAGNPNNIEFVTRQVHFQRHNYNFKNRTEGQVLNRIIYNKNELF